MLNDLQDTAKDFFSLVHVMSMDFAVMIVSSLVGSRSSASLTLRRCLLLFVLLTALTKSKGLLFVFLSCDIFMIYLIKKLV